MNIIEIAKKIEKNGGRLYLVGGAIRDELIGKKSYDNDYCVTGILEETFISLFPEAKARGKSFKVFDIENIEFALARTETKIGIGHKQFEIKTGKNISIQEDLKRRDITINSIAKDILTKEIIDPFNGICDIKNKIIRATSSSFIEDPLRAYRVARIASQTEFKVEENTIKLISSLRNELLTLSKERIFIEFKKALSTNKPSIFFEILKQSNILDVHFKEIYDLIGSIQPKEYHPEGDSYNHTMIVVDKSVELTNDLEIRFSALVHDLGKGITPKLIYPHHYGHDEKGVELVKNLGNRIGVPKDWIDSGKTASKEHMKGGIFYKMTVQKKVQFIERVNKTKLGLKGLQIVVIADKCSTRNTDKESIDFENLGKECIKAIDGKYIKRKYKIEEGPKFALNIHQERVKWMQDKLKNKQNQYIGGINQ